MGKLDKSARASIVGKREMGRLVRVSNREDVTVVRTFTLL